MESNADAADALRQAERAAAAPYIDYPPTPAWYPPATGLWAAAFCLATAIPSDDPTRAAALGLLVVLELGFVAWYRRYRGTWPRGRAPQEVRSVMRAFVVGAVAVVALVGALLWRTTPWLSAVVALVVVTAAIALYERAYSSAAARARARLA
ncbi:hypothetical protein [Nocardioides sp. MH1]|uniref:hypothetical protein n=1 Tax=Nocardioides sp. MH1 TaxID=3242490 RepID=UPI0035200596